MIKSSRARRAPPLVRIGFERNYGARPLKRAIQKNIETQLGRLFLTEPYVTASACALIMVARPTR